MAIDPIASTRGVGLPGLVFSNLMFGVSLAQFTYYMWFFPNDHYALKLLVLSVFVADATHFVGVIEIHWALLVACHKRGDSKCTQYLPWGSYLSLALSYVITFAVHCFYCHRVWIITGYKRFVTTAIFLVAVVQLVLGAWATVETFKDGTIKFLFTTPLVPIAAGVSTMCDLIITVTIFMHLWRSGLRGRSSVLRDLVFVFINVGALTCLVSILIGVLFFTQHNHYWVRAPAIVVSRCYVNSLLAVLNARWTIRERELKRLHYAAEAPSLSTIQ